MTCFWACTFPCHYATIIRMSGMNTCSMWEVIISKRIYNLHLTTTPIKTKDFKVILCKKKKPNISLLYIITYAFLRSSLTSSSSKCRSIWRNLTAFYIKVLRFPFCPCCSLTFLAGSGWGKTDFLQSFICIYLSFITKEQKYYSYKYFCWKSGLRTV